MPPRRHSILFRLTRACAPAAALLPVLAAGSLLVFLIARGAPSLGADLFFGNTPPLEALLGQRPVWDGIWPALAGTLCLVGLTLCLALVPGVGCGIFLAEYASPRWKGIAGTAVDILAGTPSIVMGLFGFTLILFLRRTLFQEANTCLLLAAVCLALLVLPVLVVSTREAFGSVPESLRITAASLGFTREQALLRVLLPSAARGIGSGVILALGRAAEDMAVIMLTGAVANAGLPAGPGAKFEALPFAVYYTAAQYQDQNELARGFGTALVLLCLSGGLILLARALEARWRRRWQGGRP